MLDNIYNVCKKDESGNVDLHEALTVIFDGMRVEYVDESQ